MDVLQPGGLLDTWGFILSFFPDQCLFSAITVSTHFKALVEKEITQRFVFWFGPSPLPPNICQEYTKRISLTIYPESTPIDHQNPGSPLRLEHPAGDYAFGRSHVVFKDVESHCVDINTYCLLVQNTPERDEVGFEAPTPVDMVGLLHSGRSIPLTPEIVDKLLPIFPTGVYDVFKLRLQVTPKIGKRYSYPSAYAQTANEDCFCFRDANDTGNILMFPLFTDWSHISKTRVEFYKNKMLSDPFYEPTVLLFGFSFFDGSVNWILDGHHKMLAAAETGQHLRFILFHLHPWVRAEEELARGTIFREKYFSGDMLPSPSASSGVQKYQSPHKRNTNSTNPESWRHHLCWLPSSHGYQNPYNAYSWWMKFDNLSPRYREPRKANPPGRFPEFPPFTAFIGGWTRQEDFIADLFQHLKVKSIHGAKTDQLRFKGYVFVEFETAEDLRRALELDGYTRPFIDGGHWNICVAERRNSSTDHPTQARSPQKDGDDPLWKPPTDAKQVVGGGRVVGGADAPRGRGGGRGRGNASNFGFSETSRADNAKSWRK